MFGKNNVRKPHLNDGRELEVQEIFSTVLQDCAKRISPPPARQQGLF